MGGAESRQRAKPLRHPSRLADRPSPPGKPQLVPSDKHSPEPDVVTIKWEPPLYDGGSIITGYLVEHRRTGSPHWVRSSPGLVRVPELTLSGLEPGWRYQFRVSAQNAAGLSEPGDLSDLLTVTLQRTAASAPYFVRELRDTVTLENEKAELTVQVRGTPAPQVSWFKDGVEVFSSRSYRVVTDNEISTLIIHQAALTDEGEIKCSATNRVGYAVSRARLTIEAPPSIRLPRQYEEGLLFEKDEVIRLKVSVAGRPVPTVTWQLNGEPVPGGGRYEVSHTERYATLRVGEARRSDRGEYQVRAVNKLGEDIASFLVTVADRPVPPGKARVVMTLGRSVTLSWTSPEDDGGCKIGNYIVEYYRLGWNMWLKAATCRQLTTTLGELIEGSEYKFRVKAENPYGVSEPGLESDVVFIPDPKRGLLEPPEHTPEDSELSMDLWLEEKKRAISVSPTIDIQYGERKTKKKKGPLASPEPVMHRDKHSALSEDSMSPPPTPENYPIIPKRRIKGEKLDLRKELQEGKELARILEEKRRVEEFKKFELRKAEEMKRAEELRKDEEKKKEETKKAEELKKKDKKKKTNWKKEAETPQSPMVPRTEKDHLHGSSELMLVLLPHSRATTEERETSKRELFESSMALEGNVAPPMSLSAPELGSGDPPEPLPVRSAFSSTELLHDRAIARFYQDMAQEEAESLRRRSSLQRRRSFGSRTKVTTSLQDLRSSTRSLNVRMEKLENQPKDKQTEVIDTPSIREQPEISLSRTLPEKKSVLRDSMDSVLSSEDPHRKPPLAQQPSEEDMEYEDSSFDDDEEDEYDEEEEDSITDDVLEEEEEEEEEEFSADEKRGSLYTIESEDDITSYSLIEEEDTYHPTNVNRNYNEDSLISAYEGRGPLILPSSTLVPSEVNQSLPEANFSSSDVKVKPILKKSLPENNTEIKTEIDYSLNTSSDRKIRSLISPEKRFEPNFNPVMPKPILKVREPSQERLSPEKRPSQKNGAPIATVEHELNLLSSSRTNLDDSSDHETGIKKKQVRIEEPVDVVNRETTGKRENNSQYSKESSGSMGEDAEAAKVLIDHYSDIVKEYGKIKRTPKTLYLNYEALKAAAEKEESSVPEIPTILVNEPDENIYGDKNDISDAKEVKGDNDAGIVEKYVEKEPSPPKWGSSTRKWEPSPPKFEPSKHTLESIRSSSEKKKKRLPSPLAPSTRKPRSPSPRKPRPQLLIANVEEEPPPKKTEYSPTPSPVPREIVLAEKKVHTYFDFFMDLSLFLLACWLYLFKDERFSIPVLFLMIYRQAHEAFQRKMGALRNKLPRRFLFWRRQ